MRVRNARDGRLSRLLISMRAPSEKQNERGQSRHDMQVRLPICLQGRDPHAKNARPQRKPWGP